MRLFTGFRLTRSNKPFMDIKKVYMDQGLVSLGGGMKPPMYSSNHGSSFLGIPKIQPLKSQKKWEDTIIKKIHSVYPTSKELDNVALKYLVCPTTLSALSSILASSVSRANPGLLPPFIASLDSVNNLKVFSPQTSPG